MSKVQQKKKHSADRPESKRVFAAGEVVLRQGERGRCAYIIEEGQVEIRYERPDGNTQMIGTRGPGTIVGELAIIDEGPRAATVRAVTDCKMLQIRREDFFRRLQTTDPVIHAIAEVMLVRFRDILARADILHDMTSITAPEVLERNFIEQRQIVDHIKLSDQFRFALENDQLELHYQPVIDLESGKVNGLEALMRWTDPSLGVVPPSVFIPIAEESGLMIEARRWAVKKAYDALVHIERALKPKEQLYMSVNFSSQDFSEPGLVNWLIQTARHCGANPARLVLEITERVLIQAPSDAKRTLQRCRNAGMQIAIDDFGTGYSSLSYLHYFPIKIVKIDRTFLHDICKTKRSLDLVKSVIGLCRALELQTVAEGVESKEEAVCLRNMGCQSAQGYYFAEPLPENRVIDFLAR